MDITINDDAFIDLIHATTGDEIANLETSICDLESQCEDYAMHDDIRELESAVEDLESSISNKCDEEYVDDIAQDLRYEWQREIEDAIENIEATDVDSLEDEVNEIQRELITTDQTQMEADRRIRTLETQVAELELAFAALTQPGVIRRAYNRVLAMSSKINWYSPKL